MSTPIHLLSQAMYLSLRKRTRIKFVGKLKLSPSAVCPAVWDEPDYRGGGGVVLLVVRVGVVREIGKRGLESHYGNNAIIEPGLLSPTPDCRWLKVPPQTNVYLFSRCIHVCKNWIEIISGNNQHRTPHNHIRVFSETHCSDKRMDLWDFPYIWEVNSAS